MRLAEIVSRYNSNNFNVAFILTLKYIVPLTRPKDITDVFKFWLINVINKAKR